MTRILLARCLLKTPPHFMSPFSANTGSVQYTISTCNDQFIPPPYYLLSFFCPCEIARCSELLCRFVKIMLQHCSHSPPSIQLNTGQLNSTDVGRDIEVEGAWLQGVTGCGITVAIVDDGKAGKDSGGVKLIIFFFVLAGVEYTHFDLQTNYVNMLLLLLKLLLLLLLLLFLLLSFSSLIPLCLFCSRSSLFIMISLTKIATRFRCPGRAEGRGTEPTRLVWWPWRRETRTVEWVWLITPS